MRNDTRDLTPPLGLGQCGFCGGDVVPIPNCTVPTRKQLQLKPWADHCITSPRWRWCPKTELFACWYGPGEPPESIPGASLSAIPDNYRKGST